MRRSFVPFLALALSTSAACDGAGLQPTATSVRPEAPQPDLPDEPDEPELPIEPLPVDGTVIDGATPLDPVAPSRRPLPSGLTEGAALIVERDALEGRFLYGMGADPDGDIASIGGGAAGLMPLRAEVRLIPAGDGGGGGTFEIRAVDPATGLAVEGEDGLIEAYAYVDLDADTIRVDFSQALTPLEISVYGSCRFTQSGYELHAPPVYADGLLTWPADERYTREGECRWVPRQAQGLHVHYLRHELAGRDFVPRAMDPEAPFGFFLAGTSQAPTLARLPGLSPEEPARTYTYYLVDFPEAFVPAAEATFEAWNDALEGITGRRPFATAPAPEGLIAWDPRFNAVVWDATSGAGAVAPFTNDPDTGEIFQSLVVMWFGELDELITTYDDFFAEYPEVADAIAPEPSPAAASAASAAEAMRAPDFQRERARTIVRPLRPRDLPPRVLSHRAFVSRPLDRKAVRAARAHHASLARELTDQEVSDMIVVDFLLHELGHNLGLRHNFIGSADKHRHDTADTASTTMDYVIGMLDPGSYDRDAMRYGYGSAPESEDYLYCTDETMELDPACIQWDYGHPIRYQLGYLDALFAAYPPETDDGVVQDDLRWLDGEFNRARQFINTDYEKWDEASVDTFDELLARVDCGRECTGHAALRGTLALYLLYTRHMVTAWWEPDYPDVWLDFPGLTQTQAARLMSTFFEIVTGRGEPVVLRTTIVGKLPTSAVPGARELLSQLRDHFAGLSVLGDEESAVKAAVDAAYAQL